MIDNNRANMMITDVDTNKVYFSPYIRNYKCWENIRRALEAHQVKYGFLCNTKDTCARDYMPLQVRQQAFIDYIYYPDYLKDEYLYRTENKLVCYDFIGSNFDKVRLVIDGGNLIKCDSKIIMTEKVFTENKNIPHDLLLDKLREAFGCEVVIIPWDPDDKYGHADGMVRYVEPGHVVINNYKDYNPHLREEMLKILGQHFDTVSELTYGKNDRVASWAHLNFLRVGHVIFVPQLNIASDRLAMEQIASIYPQCETVPVEVKGIVRKGGALNCVSWNIQEPAESLCGNTYEHLAEEIHAYLLKHKVTESSIGGLLHTVILKKSAYKSDKTAASVSLQTLLDELHKVIKTHKQIKIVDLYPDGAIIGIPENIPYRYEVRK